MTVRTRKGSTGIGRIFRTLRHHLAVVVVNFPKDLSGDRHRRRAEIMLAMRIVPWDEGVEGSDPIQNLTLDRGLQRSSDGACHKAGVRRYSWARRSQPRGPTEFIIEARDSRRS